MDQNQLLYRLRTEGVRVSVPRIGEAVYELEGRRYRYFLVADPSPGEGPWRAEPCDLPAGPART